MKTWTTDTFQIKVPEIYQLELTNQCNLSCPACIRNDSRVRRPIGYMKPELINLMLDRGDFAGSYFVELQMYGETLMSPYFNKIVDILKGKDFKIGMSTNGTLLSSKFHLQSLDYLTISIDSPDKDTYERLRPGASFDNLLQSISSLTRFPIPKIDLQVIKFWDKESELLGLVELAKKMNWSNAVCREVPDCFAAYQDRPYPEDRIDQLCLNPWLSVSVQWSGSVVPCCFSAGEHIIFGNLWHDSLENIWQTSPERQKLMHSMRTNYNKDKLPCANCYMRSPVLLHQAMLMERLKEGR